MSQTKRCYFEDYLCTKQNPCGWEHFCEVCERVHVCDGKCEEEAMACEHHWTVTSECPKCLRQKLEDSKEMLSVLEGAIAQLREAIRHWAVGPHAQWCVTRAECPCDCGAAQEFEARETARRLVGLGDKEL